MKKSLFHKKFPTILGIIMLLFVIGGGFFLFTKNQNSGAKSGPEVTPKKIFITNITDSQFTVSWITDEKTIGFIKYGSSPSVKIKSLDDRDQLSGQETPANTHHITIKELEPGNTYYFKISSAGKLYDNEGQPYKVILGPTLGSAGEAKIVSGKVLNQNQTAAPGVMVYLNSANTALLSALTDKEGRWAIFLNKARSQDLSSYAIFDPEATLLKIEATNGVDTISAVTNTKNAFPVPDITLGNTPYDFRTKEVASTNETFTDQNLTEEASISNSLEEKPLPSLSPSPSVFNTDSIEATPSGENSQEELPGQFLSVPQPSASATTTEVTITNPTQEGEEVYNSKPEITGTGPANTVLTIQVHSPETYTGTVTVAEDGTWNFTPSANLTPGEHTVKVSYTDEEGFIQTLSRNFVVLASSAEEQPLLTSTPSASLNPSPQATPRVTIPSTSSGVPITGTVAPTFIIFILGFLLTSIGVGNIVIDKRKNKLP